MPQFKVGDRVIINKKCMACSYYGGLFFNSNMAKLKGKQATITGIFSIRQKQYSINLDKSKCFWNEEMLIREIITNWRKEFKGKQKSKDL